MTVFTTRTTLLAAALGLLLSGAAAAQAPARKDPATDKELAAARADLERAARRVAELSAKAGEDGMRRAVEVLRSRSVVGVLLAPDAQAGVRIAGVTPDSAAAKAGLKAGDRIVSINGAQILGDNGELRVRNARVLLGGLDDQTPATLGYVRNGRTATVKVTPQPGSQFAVLPDFDFDFEKSFAALENLDIDTEAMEKSLASAMAVMPEISREIVLAMPGIDCKDDDCELPMLMSAFRWNGLNLASLDPQLGRYFGTDRGVLVLSSGGLEGLQAGDVIQKIDGKAVDSPREAMDALRGKATDAEVAMAYLRDRKPVSARVKVPKLMPLPPVPPAPPAPPKPPATPAAPKPPAPPKSPSAPISAGIVVPATPPVPPAPPPPLAPPAKPSFADGATAISYVLVGKDGRTHTYSWRDPAELEAERAVESNTH